MRAVNYRRKKEGRTNYNRRLKLLVSRENRIVIRKSLRAIQIQIIEYTPNGDKILFSAHSRELKKFGLESNVNIPVAYLTGLLCGKRAVKEGISKGIIDLGLQTSHAGGKLFSAVKGLVDAGMNIPAGENAFPIEEKVFGANTSEAVSKSFEKIKSKILSE